MSLRPQSFAGVCWSERLKRTYAMIDAAKSAASHDHDYYITVACKQLWQWWDEVNEMGTNW